MDTTITVARGVLGRLRGLLGRRSLGAGEALHLVRCRSVHTFGMRFPLDLVWLDGLGEVVRVDRSVGPWRVRSCRRARSVLECRGGSADAFLAAGERQLRLGTGAGEPAAMRQHFVDFVMRIFATSTKCWL
jgi:uncharacterized membrane protein (UPF0127 family)